MISYNWCQIIVVHAPIVHIEQNCTLLLTRSIGGIKLDERAPLKHCNAECKREKDSDTVPGIGLSCRGVPTFHAA